MANDITARQFLDALGFDPEGTGELEIRLIGGRNGPTIYWGLHLDKIQAANEAGANVYFGVAHRDGNGGKTENITYATALWVDLDGKDFNPENIDDGKAQALELLQKSMPDSHKPSIIVDSGHGYHVYWLLKSPWAFSSDDRRGEFHNLLERLSIILKGDQRVKDIARILRLPGTMNTKDEERRVCTVVHWAPDVKYEFDDLKTWAGTAPTPKGEKPVKVRNSDFGRDLDIILQALPRLSPKRIEDYESWLAVGMVLHSISEEPDQTNILLSLWDSWSKGSQKYVNGSCAEKWQSFSLDRNRVLTIESLMKWAKEDSGEKIIVPGGRNPKPSQILKALTDMGYSFRQNEMDDSIHVNGISMSEGIRSRILVRLNENKYRNNGLAELTWTATAYEDRFHPIREHLEGLVWDGQPHIDRLGEYVLDEDGIFNALIKAWLVGAVGKILGKRRGQYHPMLVLDGRQGVGKSRFAWWLGSTLPQFYIASPVNPDDKDFLIRQCSMFVWEVEELGSTFRRSDREALKAFMSREGVNIRKPYGHYDIQKPVTTSYLGTINNEGGFLTDPTGNRRFRIVTVTAIDWKYATELNVDQVWAEAVHLFQSGASWELPAEVEEIINGKNQDYLAEDPIETILWGIYEVTNDPADKVRMADILSDIKSYNVNIDLSMANGNRIGGILTRAGLKRSRTYAADTKGGIPVWKGLKSKIGVLNSTVDVKELMEHKP